LPVQKGNFPHPPVEAGVANVRGRRASEYFVRSSDERIMDDTTETFQVSEGLYGIGVKSINLNL